MKKLFMYVAFAMTLAVGGAEAQNHDITLEDIWTKRTFAPRGIGSVRSMADGEHYLSMTRGGIAKYSYLTGEKVADVCLFSTPGDARKARPLPVFESYAMSSDEQKILLSSAFEPIYRHSGVSDYHLYDVASQTFTKLTNSGKQRLTTLSPDGTMVAFVRDNNLYWMDLQTLEEHQITHDGRMNEVIYGTTDWVYEEEFAITQGFQWSPDSKRLAFYRFDEGAVKEYNMQMWGGLYPADYRYKYPKAGEDNSKVEIWFYDVASRKLTRPRLGSERDQYLPRFQWTKADGLLAVMRMNRLQNHMELLLVDAATLDVMPLYEEKSDSYVEVPDTWHFLEPKAKKGKKASVQDMQFIISSERDGYRHLYLYDLMGRQLQQVTSGDWEVCGVCGIDEKNSRVYYTSREHGAVNKSLYVVTYGGKAAKRKCLNYSMSDVDKVYDVKGRNIIYAHPYVLGSYDAQFSTGCKYYICSYSNANMPPAYTLHDASGKMLKVLQNNSELQSVMRQYGTGRKRMGTFTTHDGTTLNCYTITPADFDTTKRYPVLVYVYGGPGNQQVTESYGYGDYYWYHMLADKGYVVFCFDGRGTGGRGAKFKKQTYGDLGRMECEDAIEAARWLGRQSWVDPGRIGIWGWSFGGYLSTLALLKGNDVFKTAVAVAPVMNWRYYDNIYTERFLGLPNDNARGYDDNSPLNFAERLEGNYLLIHGTGDDNVHLQNSMEMVERLEMAGKHFEFRLYPNKNHSIFDATGNTRLNLYQLMTDFITRKL
ncbi:MAG: S9 family peptidase [Bacteroidales bacterium]|nr:S9 family peptidase [Bacteroidales bacterium]